MASIRNKEKRQKVFDKFGGRCAYCGTELTMETMQVDHIVSRLFYDLDTNESKRDYSHIDNLNPSCKACNYYKSDGSLEMFKKRLSALHKRVTRFTLVPLAEKHGIVEIKPFDGLLYFERLKEKN